MVRKATFSLIFVSVFMFTCLQGSVFAAVFDVTDATGLQNALNTSASNGEGDTINIGLGHSTPAELLSLIYQRLGRTSP